MSGGSGIPPDGEATRTTSEAAASAGAERLPASFGRYRIVALIGQGGMGAVYEAVQEKPERRVALKVIRPGAVTESTLRRFEQESQLLGKLQHPGIAQVFEAGTADAGDGPQPYFAMELVAGAALGRYAKGAGLSIRQKLALIARVCDGVHHAHQKGIIHRDLKPGNILVDAAGQPKILDFGVARVTGADRQATMQTSTGTIVGTLPYMSPEQVSLDPSDLDIRSDVYALGVILYELLAERLPYDVLTGTLADALRTISEDEAPPLRLVDRALRGDVETIVAKALEKDRERRYASAAELAADLRRHLDDQPIVARPASAAYQISKFARRNKALVGGFVAVILVLAVGIVATTLQAARARREAHKAEAVSAFVQDMLGAANPRSVSRQVPDRGRSVTVLAALSTAQKRLDGGELAAEPVVEAAVRQTLGATYRDLGEYDAARTNLERALAARRRLLASDDPDLAETLDGLGQLAFMRSKPEEAEPLFREALAIRRRARALPEDKLASSLNGLAELIQDQGKKTEEAVALFTEALALPDAGAAETARSRQGLGILRHAQGKNAEAQKLLEDALAERRRSEGSDHPDVAGTLQQLALVQRDLGDLPGAIRSMGEAVEIWRRVLGNDHPYLAVGLANLGALYKSEGQLDRAEPLLREALAIQRRAVAPDDPQLAGGLYNLAKLLQAEGKPRDAEPLAREALGILEKSLSANDPRVAASLAGLGSILSDDGRFVEAEPLLRKALAIDETSLPVGDWQRSQMKSLLGAALAGQKRYPEAARLLVDGYNGMKGNAAAPPDRKRQALQRLIALYDAWNLAEPAPERSGELASWRAEATANAK